MKRALSHASRLLKRELTARKLSANRLSLDIGVPSGRITDILNARRSITADTAVRLGRYFGNSAQVLARLAEPVRYRRGGAGEGRRDREAGQAGGRGVIL
ncbi:MAG: helix-turn-helix transcriptional regulator [Pseudolabrys sp.]